MRLYYLGRVVSVSLLSAAIVLAPLQGMAATQSGTQGQAGNTNNAGNMFSTLMGLLSSATGLMSMSKGAKQLSCCTQGCDGAGKEATAAGEANKAAAEGAAQQVPGANTSPPLPQSNPLRVPASPETQPPPLVEKRDASVSVKSLLKTASNKEDAFSCSRASSKTMMIWEMLRPQKVEAAAGCADAMMALAQGGMQLLQGLMGLMAAQQAGNNANQAADNAAGLDTLNSGVTGIKSTKLGSGNSGTSQIKIDPNLLREGKANAVMTAFEKHFGIPRDEFANSVANGVDPRQLAMNAPKNALTADSLNMGMSAAKNMSQAEKDAAMKAAGLAELQAQLAAKAAEAGGELNASGGSKKSAGKSELDDIPELNLDAAKTVEADRAPAADAGLSPELQAVLAQKETESQREGSTIFQVVHRKYQEKLRMIYGFDARGKSVAGVANADGF